MKSTFLNRLITSQAHNVAFEWRLESSLVYQSANSGPIVVPKGFVYDKNSVPWYMRWLFPVSGRNSDYAATLHDWLYRTKIFPKSIADDIFLEAMLLSNVNKFRAYAKYYAVKNLGELSWCSHTRDTIKSNRELLTIDGYKLVLAQYGLSRDSTDKWNLSTYPDCAK